MRNYVWELKQLGNTYKSIAETLGVSPRTIGKIAKAGGVSSKNPLYEPIRSIHRATMSKELQALDIHGKYVSVQRRKITYDQLISLPGEITDLATRLKNKWNLPYENYLKDPEGYMKKMGTKKPPQEFSQEEVERRVKKSLTHKEKLDASLEPDAEYWNKKLTPEEKERRRQSRAFKKERLAQYKKYKGMETMRTMFQKARKR